VSRRETLSVAGSWHAGDEFSIGLTLKGVRIAEQFLRYEGTGEAGCHVFRFVSRIYQDRLGGQGAIISGAVLHTTDAYVPLSYEVFSDREPVRSIRFRPDRVIIERSDNSEFEISLPYPIGAVLHGSPAIQIAVILPMLGERNRFSTTFFSPLTLGHGRVRLVRLDREKWRTNLGFAVRCDNEGRLDSLEAAHGSIKGTRLHEPFPPLQWESLRETRMPSYVPPPDVQIRDLTIEGAVRLGASLSLPQQGHPPYPAFVFLQGSGSHDRNGISPALDTGTHEIVDQLSAAGFAGLRFDSRGAGGSAFGEPFTSAVDARMDDARAALESLRQQPEVDPDRTFIIGHSLGAMIAMRLASELPEKVRGIALLAPPGRRIDAIITDQAVRELTRLGFDRREIRLRLARLRQAFRTQPHSAEAAQNGWSLSRVELLDLMRFDPIELIRRVSIPILICQGARDIQVSPQRDTLPLFLAASERNSHTELIMLSDCDHLFRHEPEPHPSPARYHVKRPISASLIEILSDRLSYMKK
jgi:pimeloyl-ACP methyl ester carboxylesterase